MFFLYRCVDSELCLKYFQSSLNSSVDELEIQAGCPQPQKKFDPRNNLLPTKVCCHESKIRENTDDSDSILGDEPHTVLLFLKGTDTIIGGASLITPKLVISAAHKIE